MFEEHERGIGLLTYLSSVVGSHGHVCVHEVIDVVGPGFRILEHRALDEVDAVDVWNRPYASGTNERHMLKKLNFISGKQQGTYKQIAK